MPVPKLDADRCRERNLEAAARGLNASPVTFSLDPPAPPDGWRKVTATGKLPRGDEALAAVNRRVTGTPLTDKDVYLLYPEVGSSRFIPSHWLFLSESTLKNTFHRMKAGTSFMNSHRTGGMSTPAELPYGKSFAGRYEILQSETDPEQRVVRVLAGFFMRRGQTPNGPAGPSTDDLFESIRSGTLGDVSLGFAAGGVDICDVCGADSETACPHVPGTTLNMSPDQIKAQLARGVTRGCATITLDGAHPLETSAVYSGAVPGAGFRKARRFARKGRLDPASLAQAQLAFAPVLRGRLLSDRLTPAPGRRRAAAAVPLSLAATGRPTPGEPVPKIKLATLLATLGNTQVDAEGNVDVPDLTQLSVGQAPPNAAPPAFQTPPAFTAPAPGYQFAPPAPQPPPQAPARPAPAQGDAAVEYRQSLLEDQFRQLSAAVTTALGEFRQGREQDWTSRVNLEAEQWAEAHIRRGKLTAAERTGAVHQYKQAALDDAKAPGPVAYQAADGKFLNGTRLDALKASVDRRPQASTGFELVVGDPSRGPGPDNLSTFPAPNGEGADPYRQATLQGRDNYARANGLSVPGSK